MGKHYLDDGTFVVRDKQTKEAIGIRWVFPAGNDGRQEVIVRSREELGEELFACLAESAREEAAIVSQGKYWIEFSLDAAEYEGETFADPDPASDPRSGLYAEDEAGRIEAEDIRVGAFLNLLTDNQKEKLQYKMEHPDASFRDIADHFGLALASVRDVFAGIRKKYAKFSSQDTTRKTAFPSIR